MLATPSGQCLDLKSANRLIPTQAEPVNWMLECSQKSHKIGEISLEHQYVYIYIWKYICIYEYMYISAFYPKSPLKKQHTLRWLSNSKKTRDLMWQQTFLGATLKKQKHHPTIHTKKKSSPTFSNKFHSSQKKPKKRFFCQTREESKMICLFPLMFGLACNPKAFSNSLVDIQSG